VEIFVKLRNEVVDVWRPVRAEHIQGNAYKIVDQPYDREDESWQFGPGDEVICEMVELSASDVLAAIRLAHR
jgi:hypothetical protein